MEKPFRPGGAVPHLPFIRAWEKVEEVLKADIWMPLYIGDYLKDTQHLDAQRHGCYLLWLFHQWTRGALPNSVDDLISIGHLRGSDAPSIAQALLNEFFIQGDDGLWRQGRVEREKIVWESKRLKRKEKAENAANLRWKNHTPSNASSNPPSTLQAMLTLCPSPSPSPKKEKQSCSKSQAEEIYFAYPLHVAKEAAIKAIIKAAKKFPLDRLLERTQQYAMKVKREETEERFIPHPATWFNRGSYEDEGLVSAQPRPYREITWQEAHAEQE